MKNLTEVSKSLVKAYMKKAYNSMAAAEEKAPTQDAGRSSTEHFKNRETVNRRRAGLKMAGDKMMGKAKVGLGEEYLNRVYGTKKATKPKIDDNYLQKVLASSKKASEKSTSAPAKPLTELSQELLGKYKMASSRQAATKQHELGHRSTRADAVDARKDRSILGKRMKGLKMAQKKLVTEGLVDLEAKAIALIKEKVIK